MSCKTDVLGNHDFATNLHLTLLREWTRASAGQQTLAALDDTIRSGDTVNIPDEVERAIQDCLIAMDAGSNVPGIWESPAGGCNHDWFSTACFARLYMTSDESGKQAILETLRSGNPVTIPPMCAETSSGCCPPEVWTDPAYLALEKSDKPFWSVWTLSLAAVAVGVGAAIIKKNW